MKVTRLKSGHRITCTDSEFEALLFMLDHGQSGALDRDQQGSLSNAAKAAIRRDPFSNACGGALEVTEDRRSST